MIEIQGNFTVDDEPFALWFGRFRKQNLTLFPHDLQNANFEVVMGELKKMMCKSIISLEEFVGIFCFIYNETGGTFRSMKELGGAGYYARHGYGERNAGRGLIQLTSDSVYRVALKELGYDYDAMTSAQLDALFLQKEVYLRAVCVYISHPHLAGGSHWQKVQQGLFYAFGVAISGGADWYGKLYESRCKTLLGALQKAKIKNKISAYRRSAWWIILVVLAILCIILYALYKYGFLKFGNVGQKNSTPVFDSPPVGGSVPVVVAG